MLDFNDDDDGLQKFLCLCIIRNFADQLRGQFSYR
jgi:hypothetical protein